MNIVIEGAADVRAGGTCPTNGDILAVDLMSERPVTASPEADTGELARLLDERSVSAVPVVAGHAVVGIVTDGDLIRWSRRAERGTARDVMTAEVVCTGECTRLSELVHVMLERRIKHLPVMRDRRLVGIVSRTDIVRALADRPADGHAPRGDDDDVIRYRIIEALTAMPGASVWLTDVKVRDGAVELVGTVEDEAALEPSRRAIRSLRHVRSVTDRRGVLQAYGA